MTHIGDTIIDGYLKINGPVSFNNYQNHTPPLIPGEPCFYLNSSSLIMPEQGANVVLGPGAGDQLTSGRLSTFVGKDCGRNITTGIHNTLYGAGTGENMVSASNNSFFGDHVGQNCTGNDNSVFGGSGAAKNLTSGTNNTILTSNGAQNLNELITFSQREVAKRLPLGKMV